ncbi:MAG: BrnA antitoxin family protein [Thermodesulfobacteriota bacterium]
MSKRSSKKRSETDWAALDAMRDEDIDLSDIPEQGAEFFETAELRLPKKTVCIRLDADVLEWFKAQGKGYQTKINAVLRAHKEAGGAS